MRAVGSLLTRCCAPRSSNYSADVNSEVHDVVVIGGGVMGVWTAIRAARRGASVLLVEQFEPDHQKGSSHGDGRIFRLAYAEDDYLDMMQHSLPLWHELQATTSEKVIAVTGQLNIAEEGGNNSRLDALESLYKRRGVVHERLTPASLKAKFPQYDIADGLEAIYQPDGGVLFASSSIRAAWKLAESLGVRTITGFRVESVKESSFCVIVASKDGSEVLGKGVVVAPGAWMSKLAARWFDLHITTRVTAEEVFYYAPKAGSNIDHSYKSMPVFCASLDNGLGPQGYYGLPMIDVPGIKVSAHYCGPVVDPDARPTTAGGVDGPRTPEEEKAAQDRVAAVQASSSRFIASVFPHVEREPFSTCSCMYTSTPDHHYVIGRVPGLQRVVIAGGGSGHAFKMGPAIGDCCAALALGQTLPLPLERFSPLREELRREYREDAAGRR